MKAAHGYAYCIPKGLKLSREILSGKPRPEIALAENQVAKFCNSEMNSRICRVATISSVTLKERMNHFPHS